MRLIAVASLVAFTTLYGCDGERERSVPAWGAELALRIGELDDPLYSFNWVGDISRDAAGRIYVVDRGDLRIRIYTREGRHVRDIGRSGEGPGEFQHLAGAGVIRDTIWASDRRLDRLTYFDTAGNVLETATSNAKYEDPDLQPSIPTALFEDGTGLLIPRYPAGRTELVPMLLVRRDGSVVDTLGYHDPEAGGLTFILPNGGFHTRHVFPPPVFNSVSPNGTWRAEVVASPLGDLEPGSFRAIVANRHRDTVWSRTFVTEPREYPRARADSLVEARFEEIEGRVPLSEREFRKAVSVPEYLPPVAGTWITDDGMLWVKQAQLDAPMAAWTVIDTTGVEIGIVRLPTRTGIRLMQGDTIWAVELDEMDVGSIAEYRIRRLQD